MLFEKHLKILDVGQSEMRNRLRFRLNNNMRTMAIYQAGGYQVPETVSVDRIKSGVSLLGFKYRFAYWYLTRLKLPLRKLLIKNDMLAHFFRIKQGMEIGDHNI